MFNRSRTTIALLIAISFTVAGCTDEPISEGPSENAVPDPTLNKSPENAQYDFSPRLIEIANEYLSYSLVDQHVQWAPAACGPPSSPTAVEYSRSTDNSPHSGKLYLMFAAQLDPYMDADKSASPVGQVIVKESWQAKIKNESDAYFKDHASGKQITNEATRGGQKFSQGDPKELFIMYKLDPDTPGTDKGWVYGVVATDKRSVIASGKMANCMECHVDAGPDRLFGPIEPRPED